MAMYSRKDLRNPDHNRNRIFGRKKCSCDELYGHLFLCYDLNPKIKSNKNATISLKKE